MLALQVLGALTVTLPSAQSGSPPQLANWGNTTPPPGFAGCATVRATWVPGGKPARQVTPQLRPGGELVTRRSPAPALVTVSAIAPVLAPRLNVAVQLSAADTVTTPSAQSRSPPHPSKCEFEAGWATNVTI